jgi:hypothetical protein
VYLQGDNHLVAVSNLAALTSLDLSRCRNLADEGLQTLSCLTGLTTLNLNGCNNVTAAAKRVLFTAIPNLYIEELV